MAKLIAISDIHGCYYTFMSLLEKVKYNEDDDILVSMGDYIDRGKNSFEVVNYFINLQKRVGKDKCVCLLGNHEDMALNDLGSWKIPQNGSGKTRKSFYKHDTKIQNYFWWFKKLPIVYDSGEIVFCHAGLYKPLITDHTRDEILWGNYNGIFYTKEPTEKQCIFGHWAMQDVFKTPNGNIGIDTGVCFGNKLSALVIYDNKDMPEIFSVPVDERDCNDRKS